MAVTVSYTDWIDQQIAQLPVCDRCSRPAARGLHNDDACPGSVAHVTIAYVDRTETHVTESTDEAVALITQALAEGAETFSVIYSDEWDQAGTA